MSIKLQILSGIDKSSNRLDKNRDFRKVILFGYFPFRTGSKSES